jgi:hypothetical protein
MNGHASDISECPRKCTRNFLRHAEILAAIPISSSSASFKDQVYNTRLDCCPKRSMSRYGLFQMFLLATLQCRFGGPSATSYPFQTVDFLSIYTRALNGCPKRAMSRLVRIFLDVSACRIKMPVWSAFCNLVPVPNCSFYFYIY